MEDEVSDAEIRALWTPLLDKSPGTVVATLAGMLGLAIVNLAPNRTVAEAWHLRACGCAQDVLAQRWDEVRGAGGHGAGRAH
jgi:hypothetical protein